MDRNGQSTFWPFSCAVKLLICRCYLVGKGRRLAEMRPGSASRSGCARSGCRRRDWRQQRAIDHFLCTRTASRTSMVEWSWGGLVGWEGRESGSGKRSAGRRLGLDLELLFTSYRTYPKRSIGNNYQRAQAVGWALGHGPSSPRHRSSLPPPLLSSSPTLPHLSCVVIPLFPDRCWHHHRNAHPASSRSLLGSACSLYSRMCYCSYFLTSPRAYSFLPCHL